MKTTVLRAYELVPEAYQQKFRKHAKSYNQSFVEFARDKTTLFDKWCSACKVTTFEQLKELLLLEEFKNCIADRIVVYLNEQKVSLLGEAAVFADEYVLTHKTVFSPLRRSVVNPDILLRAVPYWNWKMKISKSVGLINTTRCPTTDSILYNSVDSAFEPFILDGTVACSHTDPLREPIRILRDTGAAVFHFG